MSRSRGSLVALLVAPVPALAIGLVVMSRAGMPSGIWLGNLAAMTAGVLVAMMVMVASFRRASSSLGGAPSRWLFAGGLVLLGATLIAPGVLGVHRWVGLGPLQIHVAAVLLPALLVFLTELDWTSSFVVAVSTLVVLFLQPDAAQAASFAAGWSVWVAKVRRRGAAAPIAAVVVLAGATWFRHDPLGPVAHVEGIVGMAAGQGAIWGGASLFALALLPLPFLLNRQQSAGKALAAYMAGTLLAAWLGDYPVPVLGYGVSPILGYYLAVAALRVSGSRG